ncbi:uncharacterized protein FIBRA_05391 [Fibroporia radiculosa]|uniref:Uncharacterized protein n=1 Tax=Fibroporia radiculosa TaxID=599839 RepID=J4H3H1_9APHY|nr:uncharacterized protein FIBRA_05391 [Fibroporia radiculosa]CCM03264.1 predicted protein [Fibroporia radiculosa]
MCSDSDGERTNARSKQKRRANDAKVAGMKAELKRLLAQPLVARGVSTRYITSGSVSIADEILAGEGHEAMVGVRKAQAGSELVKAKRSRAMKQVKEEEEEEEEWHGILS